MSLRTGLLLVGVVVAASGCVRLRAAFGERVCVDVVISEQANENSPVALDYLMVYDEQVLTRLDELSARDWFADRDRLRQELLEGQAFDAWRWEWVPGQPVPTMQLPLRPAAVAVVLFANYFTPGAHRLRVDPHTPLVVELGERTFSVRLPK